MPIYAYRCGACGHAQDVLQKMSDSPLQICPACGQDAYRKQVTAAGFQLKGSGWYVTDFRGGNTGGASTNTAPAAGDAAPSTGARADSSAPAAGAPAPSTAAQSTPAAPAAPAPAPSASKAASAT